MGEVVSLERRLRRRRGADRHALHAACARIVDDSVAYARLAVRSAPPRERPVWAARLRKLEALAAWVARAE